MKVTSFIKTSILTLAGIILASHSAQAQIGNQPVSLGDNELLMGFRATAAPGQTINLELNLGSADSYYNPGGTGTAAAPITGPAIPIIGRLSGTDLVNTYGAGWAARTDLFWGIVSTSNASGSFDTDPISGNPIFGQNTIYLSRPETTAGVQTSPWGRQSSFGAANTQISSLSGATGYTGNSTANSDFDLAVTATGANSYTTRSGGVAGQTFGTVNGAFQNDSKVANFGTGTWISVQDLFALDEGAGSGVYLGSFGLAADGRMAYSPTASFFAAPVPEPGAATYLLGAFAVSALRRRRGRSAASALRLAH